MSSLAASVDIDWAVVDRAPIGCSGRVRFQVLVGVGTEVLRVWSGGTTFFSEEVANGVASSMLREGDSNFYKLVPSV